MKRTNVVWLVDANDPLPEQQDPRDITNMRVCDIERACPDGLPDDLCIKVLDIEYGA